MPSSNWNLHPELADIVTSAACAGECLLEGYTVSDFTRVLADLGARVIKIERPGEGDEIRHTAFQLEAGRGDQSSYNARLNTGRQGIAIDLSRPEARDVAIDLVRAADVVVENFSPGVMACYGLDAATLRAAFLALVVCSISGFRQTGPLSSMQAYAQLINAISGMMDLHRGAEAQPRVSYLPAADVLAGTHAFGAICAALLGRTRTGQGATLNISMLECLIAADDITYGARSVCAGTARGLRQYSRHRQAVFRRRQARPSARRRAASDRRTHARSSRHPARLSD